MNHNLTIKPTNALTQNESSTKGYSTPPQPIVPFNENLLRRRRNYLKEKMRIKSLKEIDLPKRGKHIRKLDLHPQMDYLSSFTNVLKPSVNVGLDQNTTDAINNVTEAINNVVNGSIKIEHNFFSDIFKNINDLWLDEKNRMITISIAIVVCRVVMAQYKLVDKAPVWIKTIEVLYYAGRTYYMYTLGTPSFSESLKNIYSDYYIKLDAALEGVMSFYLIYAMEQNNDVSPLQPQSMLDNPIVPIVECIVGLLLAVNFGSKMEFCMKDLSVFLNSAKTVKNQKEGLLFFIENFLSLTTQAINFIRNLAGFDEVSFSLFPELDTLTKEIKAKLQSVQHGQNFDYDLAMEMFEYGRRIDTLIAKIPKAKEYIEYQKQALSLKASLTPIIEKLKRANIFKNGPRREPIGVLLVGPSGVGKSTSLPMLIGKLGACVMNDQKLESFINNYADHVYNYIPELEYHDGYHGQFFTVIDEFGAMKDAVGSPNEAFLAAIRMINTWSFPLHMAHLEDKGNTNFLSEFVIGTGNIRKVDITSMIAPEAVTRRFKHQFICVPKIEYCLESSLQHNDLPEQQRIWTRRLDTSKLMTSDFEMNHLEYYRYDILAGCYSGNSMSYSEVSDLIIADYLKSKIKSDNLLSDHSSNIRDSIKMHRSKWSDLKPQMEGIYGPIIDPMANYFRRSLYELLEMDILTKTAMEEITDFINPAIECLYNNRYLIALGIMIPIIGLFCQFLQPPLDEQYEKEKKAPLRAKRHQARRVGILQTQLAQCNQNAHDVINTVVNNNLYFVEVDGKRKGYFLFLKGKLGVIPHHYYDRWTEQTEEGKIITIKFVKAVSPEMSFEFKFKDLHFFEYNDSEIDLIYCYVNVKFDSKDLVKFLTTAKDDKIFGAFGMTLVDFDDKDKLSKHTITGRMVGAVNYSNYKNEYNFMYPIATQEGQCGLPLFSTDSHLKTVKLIGIHVAGNGKNMGMSAFIDRDSIEDFMRDLVIDDGFTQEKFSDICVVNELVVQSADDQFEFSNKFLTKSRVKKVPIPSESNIIPSPLHNAWGESTYCPAMLKRQGDLDPWVIARKNYSSHFKSFDMGLLRACTRSYINQIHRNSLKDEFIVPRIFTFEEAVIGIEGSYKSIPRSTSAGYPYCLEACGKGKKIIFGDGDYFDLLNPKALELKHKVMLDIKKMSVGVRPQYYYIDYLKDERRPIPKATQGKTRLFSAAPLDYTIISRMYFGDFTRWLKSNKIINGICVGVNPFSVDWHIIADTLLSVGNNMIFGDFSRYDASLSPTIMYQCLYVIESYYTNSTPVERRIRRVLFEDVVNSNHIANVNGESYAYEWSGSNPSGTPLTTFVNSICNCIMIRYCLAHGLYGYSDQGCYPNIMPDFDYIESNLRVITYGDDNGISISTELVERGINQQLFTEEFAKIGMIYTSEDKETEELGVRTLDKCSFLKCGFIFNENIRRYVAPQELLSILEMPYWTKTKSGDPESVQKSVQTLLDKLSLWGKEKFQALAPKILRASAEKLDFHPIRSDYESCFHYIITCDNEFE